MTHHRTHVVIGVVPGQSAVLARAASIAEQLGADLICASVDSSRYTIETPDGENRTMPIDPDLVDEDGDGFDAELKNSIAEVMKDSSVRWEVRALAGGPSVELSRLADELDAAMIVVGTRDAGFRGTMHEFFNGSVAVQLAHHQHRPVLVVPLNPVPVDSEPPWQNDK